MWGRPRSDPARPGPTQEGAGRWRPTASDGATAALEHALDIAVAHGSQLHVLDVADTNRDSVTRVDGEVVDALEREGEDIVAEAAQRAERRGLDTVTEVLQGEPYSTILDYAADREVDLVVMSTHGRERVERLLLGSTTDRVLRRADVPVLTLRPDEDRPRYPYRNVLVPTDGSDCAREALRVGVSTPRTRTGGPASPLHRRPRESRRRRPGRHPGRVAGGERRADNRGGVGVRRGRRRRIGLRDRRERELRPPGDPPYVESHDVDVVVLGTHGRTGFDRYLLGSVAEKLVRTSPVPALTVRESDTGR